jgi:hypothetical protein
MTIGRYREYRRTLKTTPFKGRYVEYEWDELPDQLHVIWMPYAQMLKEFSREVANALNALTGYTHRLAAWRDTVDSMSTRQQLDAAVEFIDPLGTVALNLPYVIRSRFIFATAHLCHQANRASQGKAWKDDLPLDAEIWFETADGYGGSWKQYAKLKTRLERIGAKDYQAATNDFRNAYNHRFSPRIVVGLTQIVTRRVDRSSGDVSYEFGGTPALTLKKVVELLEAQCQHCYRAFEAFQGMVREHEAAIVAST